MSHFDINTLEKELKELENQTANPDFWNGNQNTNSVLAKIKSLKNRNKRAKLNKAPKTILLKEIVIYIQHIQI